MASSKDKFQNFNETLDNLRSILYSLGVEPVERISDDFKKIKANNKDKNVNNIKKEV